MHENIEHDSDNNNEFNINQLLDFPALNIPPIKRS